MKLNPIELLKSLVDNEDWIFAVFSNVIKKSEKTYTKVDCKPVIIKEVLYYQLSFYYDQKVIHQNLLPEDFKSYLFKELGIYFKQAQIFATSGDYQILYNKSGEGTVIKKQPTRFKVDLNHNRQKQYLIPEGMPCDFMQMLGVMDAEGKVYKKMYDKFRQLNKYLEFVDDAIEHLGDDVTIIDFGCGKAYLTFALYYYLVKLKNKKANIIGLDLKEDVIQFCNDTSLKLGYEGLRFERGDIKDFEYRHRVDMVVSLHACDTATDEAIGKAVSWGAKVIFAVPCCQHELFSQLKNDDMALLLKHGVVKDKLATIVTDTLRAYALEAVGYTVQMLEFIDMTHTPKNILIRAYLTDKTLEQRVDDYQKYQAFRDVWHVKPSIDRTLQPFWIKNL